MLRVSRQLSAQFQSAALVRVNLQRSLNTSRESLEAHTRKVSTVADCIVFVTRCVCFVTSDRDRQMRRTSLSWPLVTYVFSRLPIVTERIRHNTVNPPSYLPMLPFPSSILAAIAARRLTFLYSLPQTGTRAGPVPTGGSGASLHRNRGREAGKTG